MKKLFYAITFLVFGLLISSCGAEEIDACVGAASDPISHDIDCDECCQDNGYKNGIVSTSTVGGNTTRKCKCNGDPD